jgi:hypothetical protein
MRHEIYQCLRRMASAARGRAAVSLEGPILERAACVMPQGLHIAVHFLS